MTATPRAPVEAKVKAAGWASLAAGLGIAALEYLADPANSGMLLQLPGWARILLAALGPTLVVTLAAYRAPHTPRVPRHRRTKPTPAPDGSG